MQEQMSNDLILLEKNYTQKFKFNAEVADRMPSQKFRQPHFSFEGKKVIWFGGKTTLYSVDMRDLSLLKIENMMPSDIQGAPTPEPLHVVADFDREKVLATFYFDQEFVMSYSEKSREADIHLITELFPKLTEPTCLDLDKKKVFGFIGGHTMKEDGSSMQSSFRKKAIVTAFTFNKNLKIVANIELPADKCSSVGSILVSPEHEDLIYVNTDGPLFILGLNVAERKFHIIKAVNYQNKGKFTLH